MGMGLRRCAKTQRDPKPQSSLIRPTPLQARGRRLYTHWELDHEELFRVADTLTGDFLMTYENAEGVRTLAARHGFDVQAIAMKSTHHAEMTELLIGRNLDWARQTDT